MKLPILGLELELSINPDEGLANYLKEGIEKGVIDYAIRANQNPDGSIHFYIHPASTDGKTVDFLLEGPLLLKKFTTGEWK